MRCDSNWMRGWRCEMESTKIRAKTVDMWRVRERKRERGRDREREGEIDRER